MKILTDVECMSGSGWLPTDTDLECPECSNILDLMQKSSNITCPECKTKLKIEVGVLKLHKIVLREVE